MAKKKVILIIVEGPSDQDALERYFVRYFDSERVITKVIYGDITTQRGANRANIKSRLGKVVKRKLDEYKYKNTDVSKIIHIVDMDGAYIDNEFVKEASDCSKPVYEIDCIKTDNVKGICERNAQKREIINALKSNTSGIYGGIPYSLYYMSCNLDHVLYDLPNATDEQKESYSMEFSERYIDNLDEFIRFIRESTFSQCISYESSWDFIQEECHSLERYSNLGLCFQAANID